jgi:hypothetical protein
MAGAYDQSRKGDSNFNSQQPGARNNMIGKGGPRNRSFSSFLSQ